jgi:hypothetical protein
MASFSSIDIASQNLADMNKEPVVTEPSIKQLKSKRNETDQKVIGRVNVSVNENGA